jgi:hypothetical protein
MIKTKEINRVKNYKMIFYLLVFLFLIWGVKASIQINVTTQDSFNINQKTYFNYTIISDKDQEITFYPYIKCQSVPLPFIKENTILLKANQEYSNIYSDFTVTSDIEPQTCKAYVQILSPTSQKEEKSFSIITNPSFLFSIKTCKDSSCSEKTNSILKNQEIYIDYDSSVSNPEIIATLISPSGKSQKIQIPTDIRLSEIGTYTINVQASKQEYRDISASKQIGVINREANISEGNVFKSITTNLYLVVAIIAVLIILISFITLKLVRHYKTKKK